VGRLKYSGKFDAKLPIDGTDAHSHGHLHVDSVSAHALHAPVGAIIVPDAQLLFNGDFKRSGVDLVLSNGDHELVLLDYFKGEKRAALSSPDGAHLTGDIINALTGHQQFAQADGSASVAKVIGHVSKLAGTATAIRNGVSIILNNGDDVQKGDVVQSGSNSTLGITFIDGTVFGLSSNAKMVLNEMVYDPNGSSNSSLISLVAGTISFVAGETAKHGDMKVDTPVATMGIRGTAVLVEIDFDVPQNGAPSAKFQVLVEPDGHTGNYVLFDKVTLAPIATVDQAGVVKSLSQGILTSYSAPLSADVQKLITDVFSLKFTDNTNPNTKSFDHFTDTLLPQAFTPIKLADGATAIPIIVNVNTTGTALSSGPGGPVDPHAHIPGPPLVVAVDGALIERIGVTHSSAIDTVTGTINFVDINAGDTPTVTTKFDSFTYQNAQHQDVTATLNALQLADIAKVEASLLLTPDPGNNNNGSVTWTYSVVDSAFDFLAIGETLTLTYEARVDNNFAPNDEAGFQKFTITITRGSNDIPVITTGPQTVPFSGGTTTPGGDLPATAPTSGTLAFTDSDLTDTHTVSAKLTSAVLPGVVIPPGPLAAFEAALSASIAADSTGSGSGTINWKLADLPVFLADFIPKGETLTLTYTVTVTDSQNATATQNIIVTITGTAAPAVVWVATTAPGSPPGGLWSDAANWETGTVPTLNDDVIIITDQLRGLTPSYPVTIKTPAFAKSVTMNDFGSSAPELINQSTLTISGVLGLAADSIVDNSGTIGVGGLMEVLNTSVLQNSGLITLANGGDFKDHSTISNTITGTIDVTGGTLNVQVDIANSGKVKVESNAKLTLGAAAFDGGTVTNNGEIDLAGSAVLKNGSLGNSGHIKVSGSGNALDNENVKSNHILEVLAGGALLLDLGTAIANAGGNVTVDGTATLTLDSASIDGGTVTDNANGIIDLAGNAVLKNGVLGNSGHINVSGTGNALDGETVANTGGVFKVTGTLTLDFDTSITGGILTNTGLVHIESAAGATLDGVQVNNDAGTIQIDTISFDGKLIADDGTTITGGNLTIGSLGLFEVETPKGATLDGVTVGNSGVVQVDTGSVLSLTGGTTITGGTITDNGTIDVLGDGTINGSALLQNGSVTVESGATLTLDDVTIDGTKITGTDATDTHVASVVQTGSGTVTLDGATIAGGTLINDGTLDSIGTTFITDVSITNTCTIEATGGVLTIDGTVAAALSNSNTIEATGGKIFLSHETVTNTGTMEAVNGGLLVLDHTTVDNTHGTIEAVDPVGPLISTVKLHNAAITGGVVATVSDGIIDATGGVNTISAATVNNSGTLEVTGGTLTIDAASTVNNCGLFEANGGDLIVNTELSGNAEIGSASLLELGGAHSSANVTFLTGSTGTLKLDHSESFTGTVSGLDDNTLDLGDITSGKNTTITYSGDSTGGTLTIVNNADGSDIAHISLTGNYLGSSFVSTSDGQGGTSVTEVPGAIAGLDAHGNAIEGVAVTALITDGGQLVTNATYQWLLDGQPIANATNATYVPNENDEGHALTVNISFADALHQVETSSASAGTVAESPTENATISLDGAAVEGQQITATVTDPDAPASGILYTWTVDGVTVCTGIDANSYTPTEGNEGGTLAVAVSFTDTHGNAESGTASAGTVAESPTEHVTIALAGLNEGHNAVQGQQITASINELDAPASGIVYAWTVGGTVQGGGGNTYTPTEADEGKAISVAVSFIDTHGNTEIGTASAGTVQESTSSDLVATLDSMIAKEGVAIHVTGVTDGGNPVPTGLISYAWQDSSDGGAYWTTVGYASSYTPGESDEGKAMQLVVTYTEAGGSESSTYSLGVPTDLVATLDSTTAKQGVAIHVTGAKDGGSTISSGLSYAWQVSSDNGLHWATVGLASSYTPVQADAGKALQVIVTYVDPGEHESATYSVGTVAPAKEWKGGDHDWQTPGQWTLSGVPASSDDAVVGASGTYTLKISEDANAVAHSLTESAAGATVEIVEGHTLTLGGDLTNSAGTFKIDSGATLKDIAANATISGNLTDNGTIEAAGGTLEIASTVSGTGKFKIDAGATLQLDHADGHNVVFAGPGELILKDPTHFTGTISHSGGSLGIGDVIDVAGFDDAATVSYTGNESGGTVTISESHHTVTLHVGANSTHWSQGVSDGHGGILIHDPPDGSGIAAGDSQGEALLSDANAGKAPAPPPTTVAATGIDQALTGTAGSDTFVFNFAGIGHDTVANFDPAHDVLQLGAWAFAKPQAILDVTQDDGHGNTVISPDAHDTITLSGVLKAQLSLTDFHTV
jgi:fibronectin-binding autotransporter adhesin